MSIFREQIVKRFTRSSKWSDFIKQIKKEREGCAICGKKKGLEGHHRLPFHLYPKLELDPDNVIILCRKHHFIFGHLEYWESYNTQIAETTVYFKALLKGRP